MKEDAIYINPHIRKLKFWQKPIFAYWWITLLFDALENQHSMNNALRGEETSSIYTYEEIQHRLIYSDESDNEITPSITTIDMFLSELSSYGVLRYSKDTIQGKYLLTFSDCINN